MKQQVHALKDKTASQPGSAALHAALASYYDLLRDTSSALNSLNIAAKLDPLDMDIAWLHLKVQRGKDLEDRRTYFEEQLLKHPPLGYKMPLPVQVSSSYARILSGSFNSLACPFISLRLLAIKRASIYTHSDYDLTIFDVCIIQDWN